MIFDDFIQDWQILHLSTLDVDIVPENQSCLLTSHSWNDLVVLPTDWSQPGAWRLKCGTWQQGLISKLGVLYIIFEIDLPSWMILKQYHQNEVNTRCQTLYICTARHWHQSVRDILTLDVRTVFQCGNIVWCFIFC